MITLIKKIRGVHIILFAGTVYMTSFLIGVLQPGMDISDDSGSENEMIRQEGRNSFEVPGSFVKKIFLNNVGLNAIIVIGSFSLLVFSMIILVFNAIQIGYLIKGLFIAYGMKVAFLLVVPHLFVELVSQLLSLYLAYVIMRNLIFPVIMKGIKISFPSQIFYRMFRLVVLILLTTFLGAIVEVFVTPILI